MTFYHTEMVRAVSNSLMVSVLTTRKGLFMRDVEELDLWIMHSIVHG